MNRKRIYIFFTFIILTLLAFNFSYALTIAPAKVEFNVNPGEEIRFSIYTRNDGEASMYLYSVVKGFTEDEGGTKIWVENAPEREWVKIDEKVFAPPGEMLEVPVVINIPQDAPPGGHFLAIGFGTLPPDRKEGGIAIGVNVLGLVYINVSGNRIDKISISDFEAKRFYFKLPIKFSYKIKNEGNTYVRPTGEIQILNAFGKPVDTLKVNEKEFQILPGKEKMLENELKKDFMLGFYRATFNINYGMDQKETLLFNYWFFVIPIKFIISILIVLLVIIFVIPKIIKKYNEYIIKKANQQKIDK